MRMLNVMWQRKRNLIKDDILYSRNLLTSTEWIILHCYILSDELEEQDHFSEDIALNTELKAELNKCGTSSLVKYDSIYSINW